MTRPAQDNPVQRHSRLTDYDIHLFREGNHYEIQQKLGSHLTVVDGVPGVSFGVWAPSARTVSVMGDFNEWQPRIHFLNLREDGSGVWEGFVPGVRKGTRYKYHVESTVNSYAVDKGDPYGFYWETAPRTASVVWDLAYEWGDRDWMRTRGSRNHLNAPWSIYEVHLGSWRRVPEEGSRRLTYRELAETLVPYVLEMGFTHVEFMPVMEHPLFKSWGYQVVGYFAPTSRFGTPQDFMYLVDCLHRAGIGVVLDWVPSHFPTNENGLQFFDGTHLYEHADPRQGFHPEWKTSIFNYGRHEVRNFLISNGLFWLERYHADALRVDAVASMLHLNQSRQDGQWVANRYGGSENLEAVEFVRDLNTAVYRRFPDVQTIAEESSTWPRVSRPVENDGLGFGMKWNMGWMNDTLEYFKTDPIERKHHHNKLTFGITYAFTENFVLPLSHDEVVHGKRSLQYKMPGDDAQRVAGLRALLGYQFTHPGKKLLFMGAEIAQWNEWYQDTSLDWHLLDNDLHAGAKQWVADLNRFYCATPALYEMDNELDGFRWVDCNDVDQSVVAYLRFPRTRARCVLTVCNFTPVPRYEYQLGVPRDGVWREKLNSDAACYQGSGLGNMGTVRTRKRPAHGFDCSVSLTLPPMSVLVFEGPMPRAEPGPGQKRRRRTTKRPARQAVRKPRRKASAAA